VAFRQAAAQVGVEGLGRGRRDRGLSVDEGLEGGESGLRRRAWRGEGGWRAKYVAYPGRRIEDVIDPAYGLACATWPTKHIEP
jgi:hypothetical protein